MAAPSHDLTAHKRRPPWLALCFVLALVICYLAFHPKPPQAATTGWDKLNHLLAFASLGFTAALGSARGERRVAMVFVGLLVFGGFIEIVQTQIPGRSGEWADLLADSFGITIGLALSALWRRVIQ
jgi:VanZ family protein